MSTTAAAAASRSTTPVAAPTGVRSADGAPFRVRPMDRGDGPALAGAVATLSARSRYLRFLSPKPRLTARDVATLTDLDHHGREALVAIEPGTGAWAAVARYGALPDDPATADVAITVADGWQGRGIGTALFALLVERAREEGFTRLRATTLAGNLPALRLLRRQGFRLTGRELDVLELARAV